jgi:hypothetical protein
MTKRILIISALILTGFSTLSAQVKKQESVLKREVTLYNPYKPSLPVVQKRSFLPDMNDTTRITPNFKYEVKSEPFLPEYSISTIKAATLDPDPLPKLYKSFINMGMGNYITPMAEVSITNERSKKGTIGFYARHYSTNGKVELQNEEKVFAGYMDNDASLFGRKFFRKNLLESSVDFGQRRRYAYGYDPGLTYSAANNEIYIGNNNLGAKATLSSITLDSTSFSYKFDIHYNYFFNSKNQFQHNFGFTGIMAKEYKDYYVGSAILYDYYKLSDLLLTDPKYTASVSPFIKKSTEQWNFKLGLQALLNKNMTLSPEFHIYPDVNFGFTIVPSYVNFNVGLSGKLEKNDPWKIIGINPYLVQDGRLFRMPDTDHQLIVFSGLKGKTGVNGNWGLSASYSLIKNMIFYSNLVFPDLLNPPDPEMGNYFIPVTDDVELLTIHGEMGGKINDKISYNGNANLYKYTLSTQDFAWNRPDWDGTFGLKYNLRDKIILGADFTAIGKRMVMVTRTATAKPITENASVMPVHFNLSLSGEYRYSKILSFWTRFNNISNDRYYEWAFYPAQRFQFMVGFTYSL